MFNHNIFADMRKQDWFYLLLFFIGAVLFRFLLMTKAFAIGFDEVNYLKLAASGNINGLNHVLHAYWSPFYPLAVAVFSYIVPDYELAGRLLQILCATLIIFPFFFFIKANYGKTNAWWTTFFVAFFTLSARFSIKAEAEFIYSFVAIIGIMLGWLALKKEKAGYALLTGMLFSLAYLARPEGIGFLITWFVSVIVVFIFQLFTTRRLLFPVLAFLFAGIGFGLVASPYLFYLHQTTGTWTISTKGTINQQGAAYVNNKSEFAENPFHTLSPDNKKLLQDEIYHTGGFVKTMQKRGGPVVKVNIMNTIKRVAENFYKLLGEELGKVLTFPLLLLLGLGLFSRPWTTEKALLNLYLMSFVGFFWFLLIPAFHINLRYFIPMLPLSFIWIGSGAERFSTWLGNTLKIAIPTWPGWLSTRYLSIGLAVVLIFGGTILPELAKRLKKSRDAVEEWAPCVEQKKAGLWLKQNGVPEPVVMSYNHAVSFYAGNYQIKESIEIPENKIGRILVYAKHRKVNYLVLNDRFRHKFPLIDHLLEQENIPRDLNLIYSEKERNGLRTLIYEIVY